MPRGGAAAAPGVGISSPQDFITLWQLEECHFQPVFGLVVIGLIFRRFSHPQGEKVFEWVRFPQLEARRFFPGRSVYAPTAASEARGGRYLHSTSSNAQTSRERGSPPTSRASGRGRMPPEATQRAPSPPTPRVGTLTPGHGPETAAYHHGEHTGGEKKGK